MTKRKKTLVKKKIKMAAMIVGIALGGILLGSALIGQASDTLGSRFLIEIGDTHISRLIDLVEKQFVQETEDLGMAFGGTTHFSGPIDSADGYMVNATTTVASTTDARYQRLVAGGGTLNITTATTTLTAAQVCENAIINAYNYDETETGGLFLPTSTDIIDKCLPQQGDSMSWLLLNKATSTAFDLTVSVATSTDTGVEYATGTDLLEPSGGDVVIQVTEGARIWMINTTGATTTISVTSLQDAD